MASSKKPTRPSLQDVAEQVGTTKMTVSRYLRDSSLVSNELGDKISQAVELIGYIPNKAPGILSKSKSQSIGVLVPSLTNQVFSEVIRGIEHILELNHYQPMLAHYGYSESIEEERIATLLAYNVDGLILSECVHTDRVRKMIKTAGIPVVEIMDSVSKPISQSVGIDNSAASHAMTERMISKGHKNIAYLAARMDTRTQQKLTGYEKAMTSTGLKPLLVATEEASSFSVGAKLLLQAMDENHNLEGIVCTNDDLAIGALFECQRQKIDVPTDMAIAGFHDHNFAKEVVPRIATVRTPREDIGRIAAEEMIERLKGTQPDQITFDLGFEIIDGETI